MIFGATGKDAWGKTRLDRMFEWLQAVRRREAQLKGGSSGE